MLHEWSTCKRAVYSNEILMWDIFPYIPATVKIKNKKNGVTW